MTKNKIIIPLNGKPASEIETTGFRILIDWDQLRSSIEKAVILRPGEIIEGYAIDEQGINVSVGKIRGRKTKKVKKVND